MEYVVKVIGVLLIALLVSILVFLITRWFWTWYFKINARLEEQRRTNALLQNIFDVLVQGNTVNAVTAGQLISMGGTSATPTAVTAINESDIPEL